MCPPMASRSVSNLFGAMQNSELTLSGRDADALRSRELTEVLGAPPSPSPFATLVFNKHM